MLFQVGPTLIVAEFTLVFQLHAANIMINMQAWLACAASGTTLQM